MFDWLWIVALAIQLIGSDNPQSATGSNYVGAPYNTTAVTARDLFVEIGGSIKKIERLNPVTDGFDSYTFGGGQFPPNGWDLLPGEGYNVVVERDQAWQPAHL